MKEKDKKLKKIGNLKKKRGNGRKVWEQRGKEEIFFLNDGKKIIRIRVEYLPLAPSPQAVRQPTPK